LDIIPDSGYAPSLETPMEFVEAVEGSLWR
jgi:hypothetical protein